MDFHHFRLGVPCVVNHDGPRFGIVVGPIEAAHLHRKSVFALIGFRSRISTVRGRFRAGLVREMIEEPGMASIRTTAMGDSKAFDVTAWQMDDMEAGIA